MAGLAGVAGAGSLASACVMGPSAKARQAARGQPVRCRVCKGARVVPGWVEAACRDVRVILGCSREVRVRGTMGRVVW